MGGGNATFSGTDFQSRVTAFIAVHVVAQRKLDGWCAPGGNTPIAIRMEQKTSGDDIYVELTNGCGLDVQAKHGLSASSKLETVVNSFCDGLKDNDVAVLVVDQEKSSKPVRIDLRKQLETWREGAEPKSDGSGLHGKIARLLEPEFASVRERFFVVVADLDDDYAHGVGHAKALLRSVLERPEQADVAWSALVKDSSYASKDSRRRDRKRYEQILLDEGIRLASSYQADLSTRPQPVAIQPIASSGGDALATAKKLIESYQPRAALQILNDAGGSLDQYFRGVAYLQLGEREMALTALESAHTLDPTHIPSAVRLAALEASRGNLDRAKELVLQKTTDGCEDAAAWAARIQIVGDIGLLDVPESVRDSPEVHTADALRLLQQGEVAGAVNLLRGALRKDPNPLRLFYAAQAIRNLAYERSPSDKLLTEARGLLAEARRRVSNAEVELLAWIDWIDVLCLHDLSEYSEALDLLFGIAARRELDKEQVFCLGSISFELNIRCVDALKIVEASSCLSELQKSNLRIRLLAATDRAPEAKDELEKAKGGASALTVDERCALAIGALALGEASAVIEILGQLATPQSCVLLARAHLHLGDSKEALELYAKAMESVSSLSRQSVAKEYAAYLLNISLWTEALEVLSDPRVVTDEEVAEMKTAGLYGVGEWVEAIKQINSSHARWPASVWPVRMGARIEVSRRDFASARIWIDKWIANDLDSIEPVLWKVQLLLWASSKDDARDLLLKTKERGPAAQRIDMAGLMLATGEFQLAIEIGYRALRDGRNDPQIQFTYFNLAIEALRKIKPPAPEQVGVGTCVVVEDYASGSVARYLIVEGETDPEFEEIALEDPYIQPLLGKRVGDEVVKVGSLPETRLRVVEILDHYVHGIRWATERHETRHPSTSRIRSFQIKEDEGAPDFSHLISVVEQKAAQDSNILDFVTERAFPLGFAEKALGQTTRQVYGAIVGDSDRHLPVELRDSSPSVEAAKTDGLVMTRSALCTIEALDCFDLVEAMAKDILVPPGLLEQLRLDEAELESIAEEGRHSIGILDGKPASFEITPDEAQRPLAAVRRTKSWLDRVGRVIPRPDRWNERRLDVWQQVSENAYDAAIAASTTKRPLYADDLGLRLAATKLGVTGFSTFALIERARKDGKLDEAKHQRLLKDLLVLGHHVLPLELSTIRLTIPTKDTDSHFEFSRLMTYLRRESVDLNSAARFAAQVLKVAMLEGQRDAIAEIADIVYEAVFHGRDRQRVERALKQAIGATFYLLPQRDFFVIALGQYIATRFGGTSLLWTPGSDLDDE